MQIRFMDLGIKDRLFIITGATAGLGNGVAKALLNENANIIAVARDAGKLDELSKAFPGGLSRYQAM